MVACILSEEGPKKHLLIANLIKDERAKKLDNYEILDKLHNNVFITEQDVKNIEKHLEKH